MKTFISDISQKEFPANDKISARIVRKPIFDLIQKDRPDFSLGSHLSISELNYYREKYISGFHVQELGELSELKSDVLDSLKNQTLLTDEIEQEEIAPLSLGQRVADHVATFGGSWKFIIGFSIFILIWVMVNVYVLTQKPFDPYPFILLNLILSCLAALQAPVIMMSQNRQEEKDRERAKKDYMINLKAELEIQMLHEKLDHLIMHQQQELIGIQKIQIDMMNDILKRMSK